MPGACGAICQWLTGSANSKLEKKNFKERRPVELWEPECEGLDKGLDVVFGEDVVCID